ncbi:MAG: hypothetical protein M3Q76_05000 [Acidobacteriota bacterium]|nr:hypothetical protein [Acidobacteriota bacterium]
MGSGSGFSFYSETWYEVRKKSLRIVLHYPVEGSTASGPGGLRREFEAEVIVPHHQTTEGKESRVLTIRYTVSYEPLNSCQRRLGTAWSSYVLL